MKIKTALKLALKSVLSLKFGAVGTDKGKILWDGDEDLKVGDEVFVEVEGEDEPIAAPDGEYITEDNKTIVVVDGKVAEIRDPEAEVADEPESEGDQVESGITAAEEEPAVEPADEPEVETEPEAEEDRIAALEARIDAIVEGINQIVNSIAALEGRIAEVEGKLASVEAPAADPVEEETPIEEKKTRLSYLRK